MKSLVQLAVALCTLLAIGSSSAVAQTIPTSYSWTSTGPLISAKSDATHSIVSVKDPSPVYYNGQWIVYASYANTAGGWGMEYLHFTDWSEASAATPYFMDDTAGFSGYHTAPQVFYFAPQNKWYLIFQSPQPQYSTNSDPTQPQHWTAPTNFFSSQPSNVKNWLDFWIICDSANCYLFFCDDGGQFYRSSTPIGNFPNGFNDPVIVYSESNAGNLFEADNVYTVEGTGMYLANIECIGGPNGHRFFRALTATSLGGAWTPVGNTENFSTPFLGMDNVTFQSGVGAWTDDFSSGGALIDGNNQTDPININNLQFLYQGVNPADTGVSYSQLPWQLGLATSNANTSCTPTAITPYIQVNAGAWQQASTATVASGSTVNLGPQPASGGSWSWSGPNGYTSTSRQISAIPLSSGANTYVATYTNPSGCKSTQTFTITVSGGSGTLIPNGTYIVTSVHSGLAIDDPGSSTTDGEDMQIYTVNDGTNQQWTVNNLGNNVITLTNVASGQLLDVSGDSKANGARVDQWPANGQTNQQWNVISLGNGNYELTSVNSGLALEVIGGGTTNGTGIDQRTYAGNAWQQWKFTSD
jgi:hypothetical protein